MVMYTAENIKKFTNVLLDFQKRVLTHPALANDKSAQDLNKEIEFFKSGLGGAEHARNFISQHKTEIQDITRPTTRWEWFKYNVISFFTGRWLTANLRGKKNRWMIEAGDNTVSSASEYAKYRASGRSLLRDIEAIFPPETPAVVAEYGVSPPAPPVADAESLSMYPPAATFSRAAAGVGADYGVQPQQQQPQQQAPTTPSAVAGVGEYAAPQIKLYDLARDSDSGPNIKEAAIYLDSIEKSSDLVAAFETFNEINPINSGARDSRDSTWQKAIVNLAGVVLKFGLQAVETYDQLTRMPDSLNNPAAKEASRIAACYCDALSAIQRELDLKKWVADRNNPRYSNYLTFSAGHEDFQNKFHEVNDRYFSYQTLSAPSTSAAAATSVGAIHAQALSPSIFNSPVRVGKTEIRAPDQDYKIHVVNESQYWFEKSEIDKRKPDIVLIPYGMNLKEIAIKNTGTQIRNVSIYKYEQSDSDALPSFENTVSISPNCAYWPAQMKEETLSAGSMGPQFNIKGGTVRIGGTVASGENMDVGNTVTQSSTPVVPPKAPHVPRLPLGTMRPMQPMRPMLFGVSSSVASTSAAATQVVRQELIKSIARECEETFQKKLPLSSQAGAAVMIVNNVVCYMAPPENQVNLLILKKDWIETGYYRVQLSEIINKMYPTADENSVRLIANALLDAKLQGCDLLLKKSTVTLTDADFKVTSTFSHRQTEGTFTTPSSIVVGSNQSVGNTIWSGDGPRDDSLPRPGRG